ncbi:MAG: InlB B-repeat-containing protein [Clostridiales bacterium]|nr:InlB B-repeat-containing protein [Clostridiales bacterium]
MENSDKVKGILRWVLGITLMLTVCVCVHGTQREVSAATTVTVKFTNNSGTSTASRYTSLYQSVSKNTYITLPEVPSFTGFTSVGWTTTKGGSTPIYSAGSKYKVTKSTTFYAVWKRKTYTISFYFGDGTTNSTYKALKITAKYKSTYTLPSVPSRSGYVNLGWSTTKNGTTAIAAGTQYTAKKNVSYYAVQKKAVTLTLYNKAGTKVWKTITAAVGEEVTLPSASNGSGWTFMGWSKSKNQTCNPDYEAGETLTMTANRKLYCVTFARSAEKNLSASAIPSVTKYSHVIFVGDSRTYQMYVTLAKNLGSSVMENVSFIAESGRGLGWLKTTGYYALLDVIQDLDSSGPIAVVFNLGVNDLDNASKYVTYIKQIAPALQEENCSLYYMSVNPVNNTQLAKTLPSCKSRPEASVRAFNNTIRTGLSGTCTYLDVYSLLMKYGYGTDHGSTGVDTGVDDGVHYTVKTYKRIYYYCLCLLNGATLSSFSW